MTTTEYKSVVSNSNNENRIQKKWVLSFHPQKFVAKLMLVTDSKEKELSGKERRAWHRVRVDLEVDYANANNFLFAYISDISETGIFIRTNTPEEIGTLLNLRFLPDDGNQTPLQLEGEVQWVNKLQPGNPDNLNPGMGIQFVSLEGEERFRLIEYIKTFAYLDDPNPDKYDTDLKSDKSKVN